MSKISKNLSDSSASVHALASSVPIVTVLGHVDHGKTTLLDAIRKSNVAAREHGGITQRIGASQVEVAHEGKTRKITFIDTPGHEAFMAMRGRGAKVADIGLLIVSAVDGVMPQTKESIKILKQAQIPYIVVLTKSDVPEKNVEKTKGQLLKEEILLEGQGGDIPVIEVSAKTGQNVKELLDLILLVSDLHPSVADPSGQDQEFRGVVIESRLDIKAGPKATVVIKSGKLTIRDEIEAGDIKGKVRSLINDKGAQVKEAIVGDAVEILGFEKVPAVGSIVYRLGQASALQDDARHQVQPVLNSPASEQPPVSDMLKVIIVADSYGSLEAIINQIWEKLEIISQKTGEVTPADVALAKSTGAVILGFNAKVSGGVEKMAKDEKVIVRNYQIIYEMLTEIEDFLEGKRLSLEEKVLGKAKILAWFPFDKKKVMGVSITEGRIAKGDRVRLERNDQNVGEGLITSLRQGKDQVSKADQGQEAGILLANDLDFQVGDVLISHS